MSGHVGTNDEVSLAPELRTDGKKYIPHVHEQDDIPYVGRTFNTHAHALSFYKKYAMEAGFNIRKHKAKLNEDRTDYRWKEYTRSRQGSTNLNYKKKEKHKMPRTGERKKGRTRCGCKARLTVAKRKEGNVCIVLNFTAEHNHPLTSPGKVYLLKTHRTVTPAQKNLVSQFSQANIPTSQTVRLMGIDCGDPSNVGCLDVDIRNVERDMRQKFLGHDAETLIKV